MKKGIREVRENLAEYIAKVQGGEEVVITSRDEPVAKLVPVRRKKPRPLSSHEDLRSALKAKGKPLSELVHEGRQERL